MPMVDVYLSGRRPGGPPPGGRRTAFLGAFLLASVAAGRAGAEPASAPPAHAPALLRFSEEASVGWVLVPVVVRDAEGYVKGLEKDDFVLRVDGRAVPIASFDAGADSPTSLVVLQDLSGSMAGDKLAASREATRTFVEAMRPGDEIAIATFASGQIRVEIPFTSDAGALVEAIGAWEAWGTTALHDAVAWLPDIQTAGQNFKRAALLVTDGLDNASILDARTARELVRQAELPVHVIALGAARERDSPIDPASAEAVLRRLAIATVGGFHPVAGPDELKELTVAIAEELRFAYVLGLPTRSGGERDHALSVELTKRAGKRAHGSIRLRHRTAYHGQPPAGA